MQGKIKIDCAYDKLVPLGNLEPHPKNPKHHPPQQIELYARIIRENGFRRSLVVSKRSGFIVKGNGAFLAARELGMKSVPVDYQEYDSEAHELADLNADNALAELGETDQKQLNALLDEITAGGLDLQLAGILQEPDVAVELKKLEIPHPPKMAWALIGVPIENFADVQKLLEQLPSAALIHTTANDHEDP